MAPYILGKRGLIHIINIKETLKGLFRAKKLLTQVAAEGKDVLFVGTKRQAREIVRAQASRCESPYVCERWLGGTLTNFRTIRSRLARLEELETLDESGAMASYSKKRESSLKRERRKIKRNLEGIREMKRLPGVLVVVDAKREHIAIKEAKKLDIPTVCLLDTDGDPDTIDLPIPANDDAMRSIEVLIGQLADAVLEGRAVQAEAPKEDEAPAKPARRRSASATAASTAGTPAPPVEAGIPAPPVEAGIPAPPVEAPEAGESAPASGQSEPTSERAKAVPAEAPAQEPAEATTEKPAEATSETPAETPEQEATQPESTEAGKPADEAAASKTEGES